MDGEDDARETLLHLNRRIKSATASEEILRRELSAADNEMARAYLRERIAHYQSIVVKLEEQAAAIRKARRAGDSPK